MVIGTLATGLRDDVAAPLEVWDTLLCSLAVECVLLL